MTDEWYVARRGQTGNKRYGPVPLHQLRELMGTGKVRGDDLVWREGMAAWEPADQCSTLNAQPAAPDCRGDGYGQDRGPRGYAPPDDRPYRRPYPRQSSSTWVLPLVIVGGGLLFGALIFGGVMCYAFMGSNQSSSYPTPTYYQKTTQPFEQQPDPNLPDPNQPFIPDANNPPADVNNPPADVNNPPADDNPVPKS